jgi:hypothetical protein
MKSSSVKLGVILIGLAIFGYMEVWGADWKLFSSIDEADLYYDVESITHPSKGVVRVWTKSVYTGESASEIVVRVGEEYKNVTSSVDLKEINCSERKYRIVFTAYYSTDGILDSESKVTEWRYIAPKAVLDKLLKALCK